MTRPFTNVREDDLDTKVKVIGDMENYPKVKMYGFLATFHTTIMKLGHLVECDKTFQIMYIKMILTSRSRSQKTWKITKKSKCTISQPLFALQL